MTVSLSASNDSIEEPKERVREPASDVASEHVRWELSEPDARARARRERLPMLVYFRADWAVASVQMDREVWTDARVIRASNAFVALKIDVTRAEGDAELYAERYGAPVVPSIVFLDADGRRVGVVSGSTGAGEVLEAMARAAE